MSEDYKAIRINLESAGDYKLFVFQIPEEELDDKLTYFTREKGFVAKSLYHDFLIATCVSNINRFLQHLQKKGVSPEQLNNIRKEMVDKILEINPKLIPSNLIINHNNVVKVKSDPLQEGERLLTKNDHWGKDTYKTGEKIPIVEKGKKLDKSKIQNIQDLNFVKVQKFWRRIGQYITIKQFEPGSELVILGNRGFNTRFAFQQYIVTVCVDEVEDLFVRLDQLGLPDRVAPPILVNELYGLCVNSNPALDFDVYKDSLDPEERPEESEESVDPFQSFQEAAQNNPDDLLSKALGKKKSRLFTDITGKELLSLDKKINNKVVGQKPAVKDLVESIQRASIGLKDPDQPIGSFIFTGYTGVGKTYTAKILAEELTGSRHGLINVDCSEYSADHEYSKLIGAPSGYIGHEQGGYLTNAVKKRPFSIILFDEIEKASEKVHQLMLQIMDEGRLTDGKGKSVSFKNAIVIMTSNLGVKETQQVTKTIGFGSVSELTKDKRVEAVKAALKKKFKPEFLNRVSRMINFDPLTKKDYLRIIKLELEKLKKNLKLNRTAYSKLKIIFDKSLYNYIYDIGIDEKFGARPLMRTIEKEISTPLAHKLLKEDIDCNNASATISIKRNKVNIDIEEIIQVDDPPFYMEVNCIEDE
jgi:ATP-dependent Clp protease ATP-binding subunit ClpC